MATKSKLGRTNVCALTPDFRTEDNRSGTLNTASMICLRSLIRVRDAIDTHWICNWVRGRYQWSGGRLTRQNLGCSRSPLCFRSRYCALGPYGRKCYAKAIIFILYMRLLRVYRLRYWTKCVRKILLLAMFYSKNRASPQKDTFWWTLIINREEVRICCFVVLNGLPHRSWVHHRPLTAVLTMSYCRWRVDI